MTPRRHGRRKDLAKHRHEQVALVRSKHPDPLQGILLEQAGKGIAILPGLIQAFELVAHQLESLVEALSHDACRPPVDLNGHILLIPPGGKTELEARD